jgi:hypothetical protein
LALAGCGGSKKLPHESQAGTPVAAAAQPNTHPIAANASSDPYGEDGGGVSANVNVSANSGNSSSSTQTAAQELCDASGTAYATHSETAVDAIINTSLKGYLETHSLPISLEQAAGVINSPATDVYIETFQGPETQVSDGHTVQGPKQIKGSDIVAAHTSIYFTVDKCN